jgi:hypothetical protein
MPRGERRGGGHIERHFNFGDMEVNVKFLRSTLLGIQHSIQRPGAHYRRVHPHQSLHICARTDLTRAFSRSGLWQMSLLWSLPVLSGHRFEGLHQLCRRRVLFAVGATVASTCADCKSDAFYGPTEGIASTNESTLTPAVSSRCTMSPSTSRVLARLPSSSTTSHCILAGRGRQLSVFALSELKLPRVEHAVELHAHDLPVQAFGQVLHQVNPLDQSDTRRGSLSCELPQHKTFRIGQSLDTLRTGNDCPG